MLEQLENFDGALSNARKYPVKNKGISVFDFDDTVATSKSMVIVTMPGTSKDIILPHPRAHLRNFVLYPILEIDPKWSHPILKQNAQFLINNLSQKSRIEITRLQKSVNV